MATRNEIIYEQALLAMMGACVDLHYDLDAIAKKAQVLALDHSKYNPVEQPAPSSPHEAIERSLSTIKRVPRI